MGIGAVLALAVGGAIYLLWRNDSLVMFQWAEAIGILSFIHSARAKVEALGTIPPTWVLLSLPTALWSYSLGASLGCIWLGYRPALIGTYLLVVFLGPVGELGQLTTLIPGTFSAPDLVLNVGAIGAMVWHIERCYKPQGA